MCFYEVIYDFFRTFILKKTKQKPPTKQQQQPTNQTKTPPTSPTFSLILINQWYSTKETLLEWNLNEMWPPNKYIRYLNYWSSSSFILWCFFLLMMKLIIYLMWRICVPEIFFFPAVLMNEMWMKEMLFVHIHHFSLWNDLSSSVSWELPREDNLSYPKKKLNL